MPLSIHDANHGHGHVIIIILHDHGTPSKHEYGIRFLQLRYALCPLRYAVFLMKGGGFKSTGIVDRGGVD